MDDSAILSELGLDPEDEAFLADLGGGEAAAAGRQEEAEEDRRLAAEWGVAATPPDSPRADAARDETFEDLEADTSSPFAPPRPAEPRTPSPRDAGAGLALGGGVDDDEEEDDEFDDIPTMAVAAAGGAILDDDEEYAGYDTGTGAAVVPRRPRGSDAAFTDTRCKNVFSLGLFVAMSVVVVVMEMVDLGGSYAGKRQTVFIIVMTCFVSAAFGSVCLCVWIWISPRRMWGTQLASIGFVAAYGLLLLAAPGGLGAGGLATLAVGAAMAAWFYRATRGGTLQFAGVLLEMISSLVKANPAAVTVAAAVLLVQTLWLAIFAVAAYQATRFQHFGTFYVFLAAVFYWTTQVFKHVVHVAVSGTVSHWYFRLGEGGEEADRSAVTYDSLRRACTTSLGSICFGSALVSVVRWLWLPLRWAVGTKWRPVRRAFRRPYELVDRLHSRFNKYAFRQVVMYGKDFRAASMDTWEQFGAKGVDSIVAEDRVDILLLLPCVGGGCFVAAFCGLWASAAGLAHWTDMATIALWVGFATVSLTTEVIEAAVTAVYACFAEEPFHLSQSHPLIFHRFVRISEFSSFRTRRLQDDL